MARMILGWLLMSGIMFGQALTAAVATADDHEFRQITVTGQGEASTEPDMAMLTIGVESQAKTPGKALSENGERMNAVIARLKSAGVGNRDLRTSQLGIWPVYSERNQPQRIVGYRASNQLRVTVRDINQLDDILDQAVADGANRVNGPSFSVANPDLPLTEARKAAVQDAIAKAQQYAAAANVELGHVLSIEETGSPSFLGRQMRAESMAASTPIAPGENTFSASVTMTFAIE
ncbi:MAG: SIMPL domain-containing protein [Pseudomonadota bacterium]